MRIAIPIFTLVWGTASLAAPAMAASRREAPRAFDAEIAQHAQAHGIPEALVHRVILRESRYNAHLVSRHGHYGLMQISFGTARSMGYRGAPSGLLDPEINLTYGVPYLANAYRAAGNSEAGAVRLYSSGYYPTAKKKGLLTSLRSASSPSLAPPPTAPAPVAATQDNPFLRFFENLSSPSLATDAPAERPAESQN